VSSSKRKIRISEKVSARYFMPEAMPIVLCGACLTVALEYSEKAREIYNKIVESYRLPDIKEAFNELELEVPPGGVKYKKIINDLGIKKSKNKDESKLWRPDSEFLNRLTSTVSGYSHLFEEWFDLEREEIQSTDFRYWSGLINELIRVGFNNEAEQAKGIYKIRAESSPTLVYMIMFRSFTKYNNVEIVDDGIKKAIKIAGETHDFTKLLEDRPTSRKHRVRTKAYKKAVYKLHQDEKVAEIAVRWYFSRVVYSGPTELCNVALRNGIILEATNVSNEIKECDYAMGYPRRR